MVSETGGRHLERRVAHDRAGLIELPNTLAEVSPVMRVAVERAEGLLVESLLDWGHTVYPVSPRVAARARECYRAASCKDDVFDAFVLANSLRHEHAHWRPLAAPGEVLAELKGLIRDRHRLMELQRVIESQLRATLDAYHPAPVRLFSTVDRQITLDFIRDYPTPQSATHLAEGRMAPSSSNATAIAAASRPRARRSAPAEQHDRVRRDDGRQAAHRPRPSRAARAPQCQLKDFDRAVATVLRRHPDHELFLSFPRIADVIAATLIAEIGEDRTRYPTAGVLAAEAGLAPVTRASGRPLGRPPGPPPRTTKRPNPK